MGLNKFCCRCDAIISHRDKYCKECQEEIEIKRHIGSTVLIGPMVSTRHSTPVRNGRIKEIRLWLSLNT